MFFVVFFFCFVLFCCFFFTHCVLHLWLNWKDTFLEWWLASPLWLSNFQFINSGFFIITSKLRIYQTITVKQQKILLWLHLQKWISGFVWFSFHSKCSVCFPMTTIRGDHFLDFIGIVHHFVFTFVDKIISWKFIYLKCLLIGFSYTVCLDFEIEIMNSLETRKQKPSQPICERSFALWCHQICVILSLPGNYHMPEIPLGNADSPYCWKCLILKIYLYKADIKAPCVSSGLCELLGTIYIHH